MPLMLMRDYIYIYTSSIATPTLKFLGLTHERLYNRYYYTDVHGLTVRKIWHILCVCVSRPVTLTFDLLSSELVRNVARVMANPPANFGDTMIIRFRCMGYWTNTAQTDPATL